MKKNEIKVSAWPNTRQQRTFTYEIEDTGFSVEEWETLSDSEKQTAIQKLLDQENEQPYWEFDSIL